MKDRAISVVGNPPGLTKISVPNGADTCAFIRFETAELLQTFVQENSERVKALGMRLKRNTPPEHRSQNKFIYETMEQARKQLVDAGLPNQELLTTRSKIFRAQADGEALLLGTLVGNSWKWEAAAPQAMRS